MGPPCRLPLVVIQIPPDPVPARRHPPPCRFHARRWVTPVSGWLSPSGSQRASFSPPLPVHAAAASPCRRCHCHCRIVFCAVLCAPFCPSPFHISRCRPFPCAPPFPSPFHTSRRRVCTSFPSPPNSTPMASASGPRFEFHERLAHMPTLRFASILIFITCHCRLLLCTVSFQVSSVYTCLVSRIENCEILITDMPLMSMYH